MKLTAQIEATLKDHCAEVRVIDNRGDGHFVEVLCIDDQFEGKTLLAKSRLIFSWIKPFENKVHAWSVKGFTPTEWREVAADFEPQVYKHYQQ